MKTGRKLWTANYDLTFLAKESESNHALLGQFSI